MTNQAWSNIGSGTIEQTRAILPAAQRGNEPNGQGLRAGTQVMVGNPEDLLAVDAFAASGVPLTTATVELIGPHSNPLPRCRKIIIENEDTTNDVLISHKPNFVDSEAFVLNSLNENALSRVELPLLHNVTIYARTEAGTASVRILIF